MSPFCLINVAEIRDHAATAPEWQESIFCARLNGLIAWVTRLLRVGRG